MPVFEIVVYGILVPGFVAGLSLVALWWRKHQVQSDNLRTIGTALAVAAAFLVAYALLIGVPPFPAIDAVDWLFYLAPVFLAAGLVAWFCKFHSAVQAGIWLVVGIGVSWLLLRTNLEYTWDTGEGIFWIAAAGLVSALLLMAGSVRRDEPGPVPVAFVMALLAGSSLIIMLKGESLKIGQAGVILASITGASLITSLVARKFSLSQPALTMVAGTFSAMLINVYFFAYLSLPSTLLLSAAGLFAMAPGAWFPGSPNKRTVMIIRLVALVAFMAGAYFMTSQPETADPYGYY